jgi:hypothetical protein
MNILPELSYERIDDGPKKNYLHPIHYWTQSVNIHSHVCVLLNFLFAKKEKIVADIITFIQSFTTIAKHFRHTQVEIQLVIITLQSISLVFFSWEDVGGGGGFQTPRCCCYWQKYFHWFLYGNFSSNSSPLMSLTFTKKVITKSGLQSCMKNIKLESSVSVFCILPMLKSSSTKNYGLTWLRHSADDIYRLQSLVVRQTPEGDLLGRSLVGSSCLIRFSCCCKFISSQLFFKMGCSKTSAFQ